jgi:hypothetical protein
MKQPVVPAGWVTRVSKTPLQRGSRGDDVKAAQELVGVALTRLVNEATEAKIGKPLVDSLRKLAAANKIKITDIFISYKNFIFAKYQIFPRGKSTI